jgi:hypothetical protein
MTTHCKVPWRQFWEQILASVRSDSPTCAALRIAYRRYRAAVTAEQQRQAAFAARADQQHAFVMAGDGGVYGAYPPIRSVM